MTADKNNNMFPLHSGRLMMLVYLALCLFIASCGKISKQTVLDFSKYTATNADCEKTGTVDSLQWNRDLLNLAQDTAYLNFADAIVVADTLTGNILITPPCPNPSNGLFIWNINTERGCKLKLACINQSSDILYLNAYGLPGGPFTILFDFRQLTAFRKNGNYRMCYGFYNFRDSLYYAGYGDFRIQ